MIEKIDIKQNQKRKISKISKASAITSILLFFTGFLSSTILKTELSLNNNKIFSLLAIIIILATFLLPIPFILGLVGISSIEKATKFSRSFMWSLFGILISILALWSGWLRSWPVVRGYAVLNKCKYCMKEVGKAFQVYKIKHSNKYPIPEQWCDLLVKETEIDKQILSWHYYAMNPNCEPNSPKDVVLLFETKGGWNQFGGPEILTFDNHKGKGCNVLYNTGRVEFVRPNEIGKLKWKEK